MKTFKKSLLAGALGLVLTSSITGATAASETPSFPDLGPIPGLISFIGSQYAAKAEQAYLDAALARMTKIIIQELHLVKDEILLKLRAYHMTDRANAFETYMDKVKNYYGYRVEFPGEPLRTPQERAERFADLQEIKDMWHDVENVLDDTNVFGAQFYEAYAMLYNVAMNIELEYYGILHDRAQSQAEKDKHKEELSEELKARVDDAYVGLRKYDSDWQAMANMSFGSLYVSDSDYYRTWQCSYTWEDERNKVRTRTVTAYMFYGSYQYTFEGKTIRKENIPVRGWGFADSRCSTPGDYPTPIWESGLNSLANAEYSNHKARAYDDYVLNRYLPVKKLDAAWRKIAGVPVRKTLNPATDMHLMNLAAPNDLVNFYIYNANGEQATHYSGGQKPRLTWNFPFDGKCSIQSIDVNESNLSPVGSYQMEETYNSQDMRVKCRWDYNGTEKSGYHRLNINL